MPSASTRSALPQREETERLPCFATAIPRLATRSAAAVERLKLFVPSPPVPAVSTHGRVSARATVRARARRPRAKPASSAGVSPFERSAARKAACSERGVDSAISSARASSAPSGSRPRPSKRSSSCARSVARGSAESVIAHLPPRARGPARGRGSSPGCGCRAGWGRSPDGTALPDREVAVAQARDLALGGPALMASSPARPSSDAQRVVAPPSDGFGSPRKRRGRRGRCAPGPAVHRPRGARYVRRHARRRLSVGHTPSTGTCRGRARARPALRRAGVPGPGRHRVGRRQRVERRASSGAMRSLRSTRTSAPSAGRLHQIEGEGVVVVDQRSACRHALGRAPGARGPRPWPGSRRARRRASCRRRCRRPEARYSPRARKSVRIAGAWSIAPPCPK